MGFWVNKGRMDRETAVLVQRTIIIWWTRGGRVGGYQTINLFAGLLKQQYCRPLNNVYVALCRYFHSSSNGVGGCQSPGHCWNLMDHSGFLPGKLYVCLWLVPIPHNKWRELQRNSKRESENCFIAFNLRNKLISSFSERMVHHGQFYDLRVVIRELCRFLWQSSSGI